MSDAPQGQGWWQASDRRWYPPQGAGGAPSVQSPAPRPPSDPKQAAPGSATAALVASILSWVLCPVVAAVAALFLAAKASKDIRESPGRDGRGLVTASRVIAGLNLGLIVPIALVAVSVPTFLGARDRAQDRAAQSLLRNGMSAAMTLRVDRGHWPTADEIRLMEPSTEFEPADGVIRNGIVDVETGDSISLSTMAESGTCFYLSGDAAGNVEYAQSDACGPPRDQDYDTSW